MIDFIEKIINSESRELVPFGVVFHKELEKYIWWPGFDDCLYLLRDKKWNIVIGFRYKLKNKYYYVAGKTHITSNILTNEGILYKNLLNVENEYLLGIKRKIEGRLKINIRDKEDFRYFFYGFLIPSIIEGLNSYFNRTKRQIHYTTILNKTDVISDIYTASDIKRILKEIEDEEKIVGIKETKAENEGKENDKDKKNKWEEWKENKKKKIIKEEPLFTVEFYF